jgi:hypothetical protein
VLERRDRSGAEVVHEPVAREHGYPLERTWLLE